jgi:hypothetical protein
LIVGFGTMIPLLMLPFILGAIVKLRLQERRYNQSGSIKESILASLSKAVAETTLEHDGIATLARRVGERSFDEDTSKAPEKRQYRGKVLAIDDTFEKLLKNTPDDWKSWVKRRVSMG